MTSFGGGHRDLHSVSRSRISPTTMTSGACRKAARSAEGKSGASVPISNLFNQTLNVLVFVLHGIPFDHDDVTAFASVDLIKQGCQCGGFSRASWTAQSTQDRDEVAQAFQPWARQMQFLQRW